MVTTSATSGTSPESSNNDVEFGTAGDSRQQQEQENRKQQQQQIQQQQQDEMGTYTLQCHCGRIQARFQCNRHKVIAWDCNCSDCRMRGNVHIIIPSKQFELKFSKGDNDNDDDNIDKESSFLKEATILYEWGTKLAKRYICKTCGILPFYIPRSNPDGVAITLKCVVEFFGTKDTPAAPAEEVPEIEVRTFDGVHWEESHAASGIASQSVVAKT